MRKHLSTLLGATMLLPGMAIAAGSSSDLALFGKDPGEQRAFACFIRHYDAAHLDKHPKQNVTDMTLLVDSTPGDSDYGRQYNLSIGVNFRAVKDEFQVAGGCGIDTGDDRLLGCGIDCDGGQIDVKLRNANSIAVEIPYGARTWNPDSDETTPAAATFGEDDKLFWLERTSLSDCVDLEYDDDAQALLAAQ